jgi:hypothetical protein
VLASSKYALTLMEGPERIGMKGYPRKVYSLRRRAVWPSGRCCANANRIHTTVVDPRQNASGGLSSLRCATEQFAATQPSWSVSDAVPDAPRSGGFDLAVKSVLVIFHTGKLAVSVLAACYRCKWLMLRHTR